MIRSFVGVISGMLPAIKAARTRPHRGVALRATSYFVFSKNEISSNGISNNEKITDVGQCIQVEHLDVGL